MRVRLSLAVLVALLIACFVEQASAQNSNFHFKRRIFFPIPESKLASMNPRPAKLRLWYAAPGQRWQMASEKDVNQLDTNASNTQRGFLFEAPGDGAYEFASQSVYADGKVSPADDAIKSENQIYFDTKPPLVNAVAISYSGIEWDVRDENIEPDTVRIEARYRETNQNWSVVKKNQRNRDNYVWSNIPAGYNMEVRVVGRDKAGNETSSRPISLPNNGAGSGTLSAGGLSRTGIESLPRNTSTSYGDEFPSQPDIQYFNKKELDLEAKITRVTKSGVGKVDLYVRDSANDWKKASEKLTNIPFESKDQKETLNFTAKQDGLYEFRVVPWSKASIDRGEKVEGPGKQDQAQYKALVDTVDPTVTIKSIKVLNGSSGIPRMDIEYNASDLNLVIENPVTLEYRGDENQPWTPITRTKASGVYTWDALPDDKWKLFIRARAQDKAANEGSMIYPNPVIIDLERPEATIDRIGRIGELGKNGSRVVDENGKPIQNPPPVFDPKSNGGFMGLPPITNK